MALFLNISISVELISLLCDCLLIGRHLYVSQWSIMVTHFNVSKLVQLSQRCHRIVGRLLFRLREFLSCAINLKFEHSSV